MTDRETWLRAADHFRAAHQRGRDAIKAHVGDKPVGLTLAMADYQAVDGGEARRQQIVGSMEDVFLDATEGDDFLGVQVYTRERIGPDGLAGCIAAALERPLGERDALRARLRRIVVEEHSLETLSDRLVAKLDELAERSRVRRR